MKLSTLLLLGALFSALPAVVVAHSSHHHNHHVGPKGDKGDKGTKGDPGIDGTDGVDGQNYQPHASIGAEAVLRLYDTRKTSLELFDRYDVKHGRNDFVGLRFVYKLGKSYEQRKLEALSDRIRMLERLLTKLK